MANTYIYRDIGTPTNAYKGTVSHWIKKSIIGANNSEYGTFAAWLNGGSTTRTHLNFYNNTIYFYDQQNSIEIQTNRVFRDTNGWYHIVVAWDTTQSTASNRVKIYVNGVQETSFSTATYPSQNAVLECNTSGRRFGVGTLANGSGVAYGFWDGSISHFHFIDGTQYAASDFGSTDSTTGEWKINTSPSVTYGNNGFFWLKDNITTTDNSPNSNTFTVGGGTLTKTEDCPSNVFATFNPLVKNKDYNDGSLAYGNTYFEPDGRGIACSTIGVTSGKYYAEFKAVDAGPLAIGCSLLRGIDALNDGGMSNPIFYDNNPSYAIGYEQGGTVQYNTTSTSYGSGYSDDDIIGIALDMDNKEMYISVNGTFQNSGDPTSGASKTGGVTGTTSYNPFDDGGEIFFFVSDFSAGGAGACLANFGNGYFGTTAVSSAGTNASGNGIFEYNVPTGYTALSTKGLNL